MLDRLKYLPKNQHRLFTIVNIIYVLVLAASIWFANAEVMFILLIVLGIVIDSYFIPKAETGKKKWIIWDVIFYGLAVFAVVYLYNRY
ncbi:hypothetical protein ACWOAH_02700 [Vagococcus vulneris]|uniref:Uncharacterized protein n=1 Tax=Vagococcus vulneris TaxID=1977869 RepID=A0A430A130_9ENTE|nr:hypothetical protein [Vagococcus vulneris]RSU00039.1 hypothetical protein CBF37_01680 [Vagococcus vulneris]